MTNTFCSTSSNLNSLSTLANMKYFTETDFTYLEEIENIENKIDSVSSLLLSINITEIKLIKSSEAISYESFHSKYKFLIEFTIEAQLKYINKNIPIINLFPLKKESILIDIPSSIYNTSIDEIFRKKLFSVTPHFQNIYYRKYSTRQILISANILFNTTFK